MVPAVVALFVSMAFTLFAIDHQEAAKIAAIPLGVIVLALLAASAIAGRGKTR
jgi:hypothetical protein